MTLRDQWRDVVALFRGTRQAIQARRALRGARRLQREGRYDRAFAVALCAFGVLSELTAAGHPPAATILATEAVFLDELARQVGQPGAAREQIQQALAVCEDVARRSPRLEAWLGEYVAWYKHRLSEQPPVVPN